MAKRKNDEVLKLMACFLVGDKVRVSKRYWRIGTVGSGLEKILWDAQKADFDGWITGCKWLCEGTVHHSSGSYDDYESGYLSISRKIPALLVRTAMFNKEIPVPVDGVALLIGDREMPLFKFDVRWSDRDREEYRKYAAEMPRDTKGRWMKVNKNV